MAYFYEIRSTDNTVLKRAGGFADREAATHAAREVAKKMKKLASARQAEHRKDYGWSDETYSYDADNNLTSKTDRNSQTINYPYDGLNRLSGKTYPDSTEVEYTYDLANKITQVTDLCLKWKRY